MSSTAAPTQDSAPPLQRRAAILVIVIASVAAFMTSLDNLVVGVALPSIREAMGGSMESLEWTVNAYTMAFAVTMIAMAALGDRFGRRRVFSAGIAVFTLASAVAAMSTSVDVLIAARAIQGFGAAAILPLSLTIISGVVPAEKRSAAIGIWGGVSGLGVALGPFVGGAVVEGISWEWIFWLNVPIGLILLPLVLRLVPESHGPNSKLDVPGLVLAGGGLFALTFGVVRAPALGWTSLTVAGSLAVAVLALVAFVVWERRAPAPMLPLKFFQNRAFALTNALSVAMFFGIFGAIFLLSQYFQTAQGLGPFEAGARTLPWTAMPMFVAPIAGAILYPRFGGRPLMTIGLALQAIAMAWIAVVLAVETSYLSLIPAFVMAGTGMALVISPSASMILESVRDDEAGQASGAASTLREVGGVLGVAVMATVFQHSGSYASPQAYTDGVAAALPVAVGVLAVGAVLGAALPGKAWMAARSSGSSQGEARHASRQAEHVVTPA
ncbi:MAG: MFS transporter [Solirubrobacteraceae bacterium]|nr:MFS transporter [Solirubrobacteraceae bacterium]